MSDPALDLALRAVLARLSEGAALPREHAGVAALTRLLAVDTPPLGLIEAQVRELSRAGYLRGALVSLAGQLRLRPRPELLLLPIQKRPTPAMRRTETHVLLPGRLL